MENELKKKIKFQEKSEIEENFRFLSSFTHDAIIQINEQGLIVYWNKSAERIFGLSETVVLNKSLHLLFAPERYLELYKKAFASFRNSGQGAAIGKTLELEGKKSNGEEFPIELSLSFQINGEWNAVGIIRDITKRKQAENENKERLKELICLYELSKIAGEKTLDTDLFLKEAIHLIPSAWQFPELIYAKITVEGKEYKTDNYKKTIWHQNSNIYIENQKKGEIEVGYLEETPIYDDGPFLKEERNLINGISERISGVLELKLTEEKLKQSEAKHQNIINNLDVAFYQAVLSGKLLNHNPAYNIILGYDKSENLKNTNVKHLWENPELREVYLEQLLNDGNVKNYICHALKKDGTKVVLQLNSHILRDKEGKPARIDGTFTNVTEKFVLEQKLIESEETYHSLFKNSLSGIAIHKIIYNPKKEPINYMITDVNPMFEEILHLEKENVINKLITEVYGVEEPPYFEIYLNVAKTMKSESFSTYFEPMDKYFKISAFSFERGKFVTSFEDITEDKLLEIELKNAHSELDEIFNLAVPICVIDSNYNITQANESLISLFNLDNKNIIGKKCYDIWQESHCNTPKCSIRQHMQGNDVIEYETEKEMRSGSKLSLLVRSTPHHSPNGEIVSVYKSAMDITLRKNAEEKLKRTLETTRTVLETLPMGIILVDNDEMIQSVNKAALSLLGYVNEFEILSKNWNEITYSVENNINIIDRGKERNQTEVYLKNLSGNKVPVLKSVLPITLGDVDYLMKVFVDITSIKEIQNQLKASQEKYLDLIETSTLGILEINLVKNKIEYVNPALSNILERSLNDIKTKNLFHKMVYPEDMSLLMSSRGKNDVEFRILLKNGTIKWVAATRLYTYGINQQPITLRLWLTDITERKKSEKLKDKFTEHLESEIEYRTKDLKDLIEKQRLYLDQIEKSSRFKTEFLGTMSHELRTPLNSIIGFTDLLIEGVFGELNEEQVEYIKDIDDSSKNLLYMITDILDISKIESGQEILKIEEIQLNNMIDQVIITLKPLYTQKDIKWELAGLKKEQFIFADRIKFKQIIYNLLSNAIKFTKKGKIIFEFKENKKDWEFAVKDTGIGISEKDFDIIFIDFKRVKSDYVDATQGTGLGLALTKRLVNIHGGNISFSSKLEKGTTFTFHLPKTLKEKSTNVKRVESFLKKI